jgi:uncharacterized protein with NRDE domain
MCILLVAPRQHPTYPLIVAANRDEFYDRPTRAAAFWPDAPAVLAGRDLLGGGTWLGITRHGRFAALTNFRDPELHHSRRPSRGQLVSDFLLGDEEPDAYLAKVAECADQYNGFSVIVGRTDALFCYSNRTPAVQALTPGVYGLSNHLLDTPWPKVTRAKRAIGALLSDTHDLAPDALFAILADRTIAADDALPVTGVGLEWERMLSPLFVSATEYGTRSSTVLLIDNRGEVTFVERTFQRNADEYTTVAHRFRLRPERGSAVG